MRRPHYLDPLGSRLPALERNILRLRSMQMVLVLFYAEKLKQEVLNLIQNTDSFRARMRSGSQERVPKGAKDQVRKCLNALADDGAITRDERDEIRRLIEYRNVIGHDIHELVADLSSSRSIRDSLNYVSSRFATYDYEAVERLRHYLDLLDERQITHHYIGTVSLDRLMFTSAERTLLTDIRKLRTTIDRQAKERNHRIGKLNEQIKLDEGAREGDHPYHPLNQYDDKRLTKRGQEVCYRLFDQGKPPMAVAHLMGISLAAARKRRRMWEQAGGSARPAVDFESLPHRKFHPRGYD